MHLCTDLKLRLFADDACLSMSHPNPVILEQQINTELQKINNWLISNKLFLNYAKSNYLIFSKKRSKPNFSININNHTLNQEDSVKYLGITIDNKLTWKPHIKNLRSTLSKSCYALAKLKQYVNKKTMKTVYYSLFYSKLQYCISSWGGVAKSVLDPIQKLQNRAIRFICCEEPRTPTLPLFSGMGMLKVDAIYRLEICKLTHQMTKNKINGELNLTELSTQHNHRTRLNSNYNFYSASCSTNLGKTAFNHIAPKFWRDVPNELKEMHPARFKKKYKTHLLKLYDDQAL